MIDFIYLSIMIIFLILGYMIRNAIMDVADNLTDVVCKLEGIETYLERMERYNNFLGYLEDIASSVDHIKYDMKLVLGVADKKGENENEKIH